MPLKISELIIQAKFEDQAPAMDSPKSSPINIELLREDIINECLEKIEDYLRKREIR